MVVSVNVQPAKPEELKVMVVEFPSTEKGCNPFVTLKIGTVTFFLPSLDSVADLAYAILGEVNRLDDPSSFEDTVSTFEDTSATR